MGRLLFTHRVYTMRQCTLLTFLGCSSTCRMSWMGLVLTWFWSTVRLLQWLSHSLRLGVQHWSGELGLLAAVSVDSMCSRSVGIHKTQLGFLGYFHRLSFLKKKSHQLCPLTDEWIKKLWYIYKIKHYSAIKQCIWVSSNATHLTCWQSGAQNSPSQPSTVHELWTSRCSSWV